MLMMIFTSQNWDKFIFDEIKKIGTKQFFIYLVQELEHMALQLNCGKYFINNFNEEKFLNNYKNIKVLMIFKGATWAPCCS